MACDRCWQECAAREMFVGRDNKYRIVNDPGYWGAEDPKYLVLGITKGETQSSAMKIAHMDGSFDGVAFKKFRPRLLSVLQSVGFMPGEKSIDGYLRASEKNWGFASVLRCSLTAKTMDKKTGKPKYSGESGRVIAGLGKTFHPWLLNCFTEHLKPLSQRTSIVFLLSNDDRYPPVLRSALTKIWSDLQVCSESDGLAYTAGGRLFVHLAHPSPLNTKLSEFLEGDRNTIQGRKHAIAYAAIRAHRHREREMAA